ncbi:replicative DNA helicase [Patescibacteria group bacterium]|nr:replicative DNA helicase [Patescibacteria group bacterium]MBU1931688.1 replicative DNA helicase [Patescibacteria group bacterium]
MAKVRIPPHSQEAEQSVLGALLIDKDAVMETSQLLRPEFFYDEKHRLIFEAIVGLYDERESVDVVTVSEVLKKNRALAKVGGRAYLTNLVNQTPTSAHVQSYAQIIKDHYTKRQLISMASRMVDEAFDEGMESGEVLEKAEKQVFSLSQKHLTRNFIALKDALAESFDRLDELHKKGSGLRGISTGFQALDSLLAGMQDSNLLILAGRPGLGKTTLALNIAQHVAVKEKIPIGFFSLEMSKEELVDRLLVAQADIDAWRLKTGRLDDEDFSQLSDAMGLLAEAPFFVDDTPGISLSEIRTKARRLQIEQGVKLIILDYLQLVHGRQVDNRVQEVSEISQGLKNLARELRVPVLALSQLSRAVEHRGSKRPQLADLRESGSIEQDADVVMFIYREDEEDLEKLKLILSKHRNGPLGAIDLRFRGDRIRFYGVDKKRKD